MGSLYAPLGEEDIRLVTVRRDDEAPALLELNMYQRTAAPEYDAVSYSWGDDMSTTPVMCNGVPLHMRTNLFRALPFLRDFRPEPRTRPLWIDAICLNQDDPHEKAIHVPRMNEVYENASRTLIWLGEAGDNSDLAMDSIEGLTQKLLTVKDPNSSGILQRLASHDLPPPGDAKWEAVKALQLRPWFFRLWTLQEIVLSKEPLLLCGRKSISWNALSALYQAASQANVSTMAYAAADEETPYKDSRIVASRVNFLRDGKRRDLPVLLILSVDRGYSEPVDRVWALLGLLNKRYRQKIIDADLVDYSISARLNYHDTFLGITKFHIEHDTSLAVELIEDNLRTVHNPSLPSWCPDWHTDRGGIPLARRPEALVGIPGGQFSRIEPFMQVNQDFSLELCGLTVDIVDCVTATAGDRLLDLESYPWLIECLGIIESTSFVPYHVYPENPVIPSTPTTLASGTPISEPRQRYMRAEETLKYVLFPPGTITAGTVLMCNKRKFFRTKAGRLGIGPANLEANDILCAMYGARSLWALRPHKSSEKSPGGEKSQGGDVE